MAKWEEAPVVGKWTEAPKVEPGYPVVGPEELAAARRVPAGFRSSGEKKSAPYSLSGDIAGAVVEAPRNVEVGFLETGESLLRAVQRRGMERPFTDEQIRSAGFEPSGKPWKQPWLSRKAGKMAENVAATKKRAIRKLEPVTLSDAPVRRLTRPVVQNLPSFGAMLGCRSSAAHRWPGLLSVRRYRQARRSSSKWRPTEMLI